MKNDSGGRSMIEMLGVLAIIGVLSAAGLAGYSKAMAKHKMNRTVDQMVQIVNNIRTVFSSSQDNVTPYKNLNNEMALKLNVFPDEMVIDKNDPNNGVINAYKGTVSVVASGEGESFEVIFNDLPKEVSIAISTIDWGTEDTSSLQEVIINEGQENGN